MVVFGLTVACCLCLAGGLLVIVLCVFISPDVLVLYPFCFHVGFCTTLMSSLSVGAIICLFLIAFAFAFSIVCIIFVRLNLRSFALRSRFDDNLTCVFNFS